MAGWLFQRQNMKTCECGLTNDFKNQNLEVNDATEPKSSPPFSSEGNFVAGWWNGSIKCGQNIPGSPIPSYVSYAMGK